MQKKLLLLIFPLFLIQQDRIHSIEESWLKLGRELNTGPFRLHNGKIYCGETDCGAEPMKDVDFQTFEYLSGTDFARDKEKIYYPVEKSCITYTDCCVCTCVQYVLKGFKPQTFRYLGKEYATDGRNVIFRGDTLKGLNGAKARVIEGPKNFFAITDGNRIFLWDKPFPGADPQTFRFVSMDAKNQYLLADKSKRWLMAPPNMPQEIKQHR